MWGVEAIPAAIGGLCALTSAHAVDLETPLLHIRDFVELDCIEPQRRGAVGDMVVARTPRDGVQLSRLALASLLRRRLPELAGIEVGDPEDSITLHVRDRARLAAQNGSACVAALHAIDRGDILTARDFAPAPCPDGAVASPFAYHRGDRLIRAGRDLSEGEAAGRMPPLPVSAVSAGDALTLVSEVGGVRVARAVHAAQDGAAGEPLFVVDEDGVVFAAPLVTGPAP